jgi:hypothetical protein
VPAPAVSPRALVAGFVVADVAEQHIVPVPDRGIVHWMIDSLHRSKDAGGDKLG